jgi:hypothetical protein
MRRVLPVIVAVAMVHMFVAVGCLVIAYGGSGHEFESGEQTWWVSPAYQLSRILMYPLTLWVDASMPRLGGVLDYPFIFANSMIWAVVLWGAWRLAMRRREST